MLSAFGVFWVEEGLDVPWPGEDLAILVFCSSIPDGSLCAVAITRRVRAKALP
jgi:uncharacterized membrane protein